MKSLKYLFLAVSLLSGSGLVAETKAHAAKRKAAAAKLKEHEKKHKKTKKAKSEKVAYRKKPTKPVTKKVAPTKTKAVTAAPKATTAKPQEKSYFNQISDALGWTGGTTGAAATAATSTAVAGSVQHRGPENWHQKHHFPAGWRDGFTGKWVGGEWLFGGHNLKWWYINEPSYYRSVVRPEARRAGITERQHFAHELSYAR